MKPSLVIFSDLDGTLLDKESYSWQAAAESLERIRENGIPLVLATSKTAAETAVMVRRLDLPFPFIYENGAGVDIPPGLFGNLELPAYDAGVERKKILQLLDSLVGQFAFRGFAQMDCEEVVEHTGLDAVEAGRALQRGYTEPLLWKDSPEKLPVFRSRLETEGLLLLKGGRFYHVQGRHDKASAAAWLIEAYAERWGSPPLSIALGDAENDRRMIQWADTGIIIPRKDGHLEITGAQLAGAPGPQGWNTAMLRLLREHGVTGR